MAFRSRYEEWQWEWLRAFELYESWNRDDIPLLIEKEPKSVRYVLHFVWDCLRKAQIYDGETRDVLYTLAKKYFTWIVNEIKNPRLGELIAEMFEELERKYEAEEVEL